MGQEDERDDLCFSTVEDKTVTFGARLIGKSLGKSCFDLLYVHIFL